MTGEAAPRTGIRLTVADLRLRSLALARKLRSLKAQTTLPEGPWYPYDIFGNLKRLWRLLGPCFDLGPFVAEGVYDIGTADGDMALLLDSFGVQVAAIDNPSTNCNRMAGVRRLCAAQNARVSVHEFDIDSCLNCHARAATFRAVEAHQDPDTQQALFKREMSCTGVCHVAAHPDEALNGPPS